MHFIFELTNAVNLMGLNNYTELCDERRRLLAELATSARVLKWPALELESCSACNFAI